MCGGGLMQLVAYGAQDVYLTGNPQITFFKVVYRRHTNFSIEMMDLPLDSARPGGKYNVQILRNGDLATRTYLRVSIPAITGSNVTYNADSTQNGKIAWVRRLGHALLKEIKVTIGGTDIDKHVSVWLDIWYELTHTYEQERGYSAMIGDVVEMTTLTGPTTASTSETVIYPYTLYIPIQFWFCRNYGLSLPLIALQYHDVRFDITLEDITKLIIWSGDPAHPPSFSNYSFNEAGIMVDYIYLDSEERRRFAQVGHEYLIEQVQFNNEETISGSYTSTYVSYQSKLTFNHPCKEIIWALRCGAYNGEANRSSFSGSRGRFLCYTNEDLGWDDALNYAALNVATGMLVGSAAAVVGTTPLTPSVVIGIGASLSESTTVAVTATKNVIFDVTFVNNTAAPLGGQYGYVVEDVLLRDGFNLCSELNEVSCTITAAGAGPTYTLTNIAVVSHSMLLRDVSIPVEDWTDTRVTLVAGKCAWDVTVIQPSNYGVRLDGMGNPVYDGKLILNGHDRFVTRLGGYFNYVQPWQHHTRTPADGINVYSFGLHPEQHQPSGTANLSRIDTTQLQLRFSDPYRSGITGIPSLDYLQDSKFYVFATNYNVLRIMSGMGGLAYSN